MSDIRTEIRDAFEREQSAFPSPTAVRAQVIAAASAHARASVPRRQPIARNLTWLMGAAAVLLAIAIVAGLMAGRLINSHAIPVKLGPTSQVCLSGPTGQSDRFATVHGYITYINRSEIWAVDPNHPTNPTSLGPSNGMKPIAWSRDGRHLLLRIPGDNNFSGDLCVMNTDGSQTRLTRDGLSYEGSLSRNGAMVVYARFDDGLYLVDAKGGTPRLIAKKYGSWNLGSPAWSPDDSRIAYLVYYEFDPRGPSYQIWTVKPDGTDPNQVVDLGPCEPGGCSGGLVWSPDGSMLAFESARGPAPTYPTSSQRPFAIYVVHADGSGLNRINADGRWPTWSPDGSRIAFTQGAYLFTMAPDGSNVTMVGGVGVTPPYTWNPLAPSSSASAGPSLSWTPAGPFDSVSMMNATTGWADPDQNGHLRHTTDSGAHWSDVSPPVVLAGGMRSAYFLDADHAWVVDASWGLSVQLVSQRTIDGGDSWQQGDRVTFDVGASSAPDMNAQGGLKLDFLDPEHGWLFVAAVLPEPHRDALYSTSDSGFHWKLVSTNDWSFTPAPSTSGCPWGAPVFISATVGFMDTPDRTYSAGRTSNCPVPNGSSLHVTHDGGVTWQFQPLPAKFGAGPTVLDAPNFVDQFHGFLMLSNQSGSSLLATSDGGSSWEPRSLPGGSPDLSISWLDDRNGSAFLFSSGTVTVPIYRTRDGGATWAPVQTNLLVYTADGQVGGLYFVNADTGFAFRRTDAGISTSLLKTTDGGRTWTTVGRLT